MKLINIYQVETTRSYGQLAECQIKTPPKNQDCLASSNTAPRTPNKQNLPRSFRDLALLLCSNAGQDRCHVTPKHSVSGTEPGPLGLPPYLIPRHFEHAPRSCDDVPCR